MSKQVKTVAGCLLPSGERLGLRRVEDRAGAALLSSHLELHKDDEVLATGFTDIEAKVRWLGLSRENEKWLLGHLREATADKRR